jgi:biotin operon repressor
MDERTRAEPSAPEQSRALPNMRQVELPIARVEESDAAYVAAAVEGGFPVGVLALVRWLISDGRRDNGTRRAASMAQRKLAKRLGLSASTVCESLRRLQISGLVIQADGDYRLRLSLLVQLAEEAASRRLEVEDPPDPAEALDLLLLGRARQRSAALGGGAVPSKEELYTPYTETVPETRGSGGTRKAASAAERVGRLPSAAERGERDGCLKGHAAWRALQTRHFRPVIDLRALQPCFYAAVEAELLDNEREHKIRFLASAWDVARASTVTSPAPCLRVRVERGACFRFSPEGAEWAKRVLRPAEYAERRGEAERVEA